MTKPRGSLQSFLLVQAIVVIGFAGSLAVSPGQSTADARQVLTGAANANVVEVARTVPLVVESLYNDASMVSDDELAAVLERVLPRFSRKKLKPNFVEHALRTWGVHATFRDAEVLSGAEMRDVLLDHGRFLQSWGDEAEPLLIDRDQGIDIRWASGPGGSVHHDHWLASLTEAGIHIDEPVYAPARRSMTIRNVLAESLRDFRLDEREVEWSAMAFGLWLPPVKTWKTADNREMSFDRIVRRLMRGHKRFGVCAGTHRLYALVLLLRLDADFEILSADVREEIDTFLLNARELMLASQFADGHWPTNWSQGAAAREDPIQEPVHRKIVATGHHLEWLAIAPARFHPPHERVLKAAGWVVEQTLQQSPNEILTHYTFYSHVGSALCLWRGTRPASFWQQRRATPPNSNTVTSQTESDQPSAISFRP